MKGADGLRALYSAHRREVEFLFVYIREAHPADGWVLGRRDIRDPRTIEERRQVAARCAAAFEVEDAMYVDEMDDAVMTAYAAWPDRLYLVGTDGRLAYAGAVGPSGFKPAELERAIEKLPALGRPDKGGGRRCDTE